MYRKKMNGNISALWASAGIATAAAYILKYLINRDRPDFIAVLDQRGSPSFPSAHSSASFAPVSVLHSNMKKLWALFAVFVAFSRVYLGAHYVSDIIAGGIVGSLAGDMMSMIPFHKIKLLRRLKIA